MRCQRRLSAQRRASQRQVDNRDVVSHQDASSGLFTDDHEKGLNANAVEWQSSLQQQRQQQDSLPPAGSSQQ